MDKNICGCWYSTGTTYYSLKRYYLPQLELSSCTIINPLSFTTTLTQTFVNPSSENIEQARYTFPLYDGVAVTAFACTIGDRVITGRVEQKEKARQTFNDAVDKGKSAGLLEALPVGVFACTLGNIPAKTTMIVNITYGGELKHDAETDGLRFTLPMSIAPRYGNYPGELLQADTAHPSRGMRITVDVDMKGSAIRKIQSLSKDHPISVSLSSLSAEIGQSTPQMSKASVALTLGTAELSTDFILQITVDNINSPKALLEQHPTLPNHQALMATFVPRFSLKPITPEIVFIADQSGSMRGHRNQSLVAALLIFLKSLPMGVRFNICPFGSTHEFLWKKSQPYTSENVAEALLYVQSFTADYGGTEMYSAVEATFKRRLGDMPLEVILLTDGQITAEQQLFGFVHNILHEEKIEARVFTLGIGDLVSTTLVEGMARAGKGFAQFVTEGEPMDQKVVRMLKAALCPHMHDFSLKPNYAESEDDFEMVNNNASTAGHKDSPIKKTVISMFDDTVDMDAPVVAEDRYAHLPDLSVPAMLQAPHTGSPLFPYNRTTVFLIMDSNSTSLPTSVSLHAQSSQGLLTLDIPVQSAGQGATIHHLGVRKLVQELEEGRGWVMDAVLDEQVISKSSRLDEMVERDTVRLGLKYQVANKWCSFVAVEDDGTSPDKPKEEEVNYSQGSFRYSRMSSSVTQADPRFVYGSSGFPTPHSRKVPAAKRKSSSTARLFGGPARGEGSTTSGGGLFGAAVAGGAAGPFRGPARIDGPAITGRGLFGSTSAGGGALYGGSATGGAAGPFGGSTRGERLATSGRGLFGSASAGGGALFGGPVRATGNLFRESARGTGALFGGSTSAGSATSSAAPEDTSYDSDDDDATSQWALSNENIDRISSAPVQARMQQQQQQAFSHKVMASSMVGQRDMGQSCQTENTDMEKVRRLIAVQDFAGCWQWDNALVALFADLPNLMMTMSKHECNKDTITMTALVLQFLTGKMGALKGVWEMVAEKGQAWLELAATDAQRAQLEKLVKDVR